MYLLTIFWVQELSHHLSLGFTQTVCVILDLVKASSTVGVIDALAGSCVSGSS